MVSGLEVGREGWEMLTYSKLYASRDLGKGKKWVMGKAKNRAMDGAVIYSVRDLRTKQVQGGDQVLHLTKVDLKGLLDI